VRYKGTFALKRQVLVDPVFYAHKEQKIPTAEVMADVRGGMTFEQLKAKYPDADESELRKKGILAYEMVNADGALSMVANQGVDMTAAVAKAQPWRKKEIVAIIESRQASSFIHPVKLQALRAKLAT
jgi:hypothetical protein